MRAKDVRKSLATTYISGGSSIGGTQIGVSGPDG